MILVDSTKYISWMRGGKNPVRVLRRFISAGELVSCGIIRIEVLRGVIKPAAKTEMTDLFDAVPEIPLSATLLHECADVAWRLDRKGVVLPATDLIIGVCARRVKAVVVTEDPHFKKIPGLRIRSNLASG